MPERQSNSERKTLILTGASRGIGAAVAQALADAGARVVLVARSVRELDALAASLPHGAVVVSADLSQAPAVPTVAVATRESAISSATPFAGPLPSAIPRLAPSAALPVRSRVGTPAEPAQP